jgi:CRISPR-associated protein Csd1
MNWMQNLYETYNKCFGNESIPDSNELCPVGYSVQNAHIEIVLDEMGNFRRAKLVLKEDAKTLIPVTEKSLTGRTSGIAPHALCDSIQYCAGDYDDYRILGSSKESYFDKCEFGKKDFEIEDGPNLNPLVLINEICKSEDKPEIKKMRFEDCIKWLNDKLLSDNSDTIQDESYRIHYNRKRIENNYPSFLNRTSSSYLLQLERWIESENSHKSAEAVFKYVSKKQVISDLIDQKLLAVSNNKLIIGEKNNDQSFQDKFPVMKLLQSDEKGIKDQAKLFIRWNIEYVDKIVSPTWEDKTLYDSWGHYLASSDSQHGLCYVTGKETNLAQKHPARLRNGGDKAKLISSNDTSGYTFLGRFISVSEAAGVSSEVTQKAHSTLRWLVGREQAFRSGDQVFVSWAINGADIPDPCANTLDFLGQQEGPPKKDVIGDVGQSFAIRLKKKIAGYKTSIQDNENIVVMGLDSATPGRMSITFYRELTGSEFLDRIENWHSDFAWYQNFGKKLHFIGAPSPRDIAWAAYCTKIGDKMADLDKKLLNTTIERLLPCIIDGNQFPNDIVLSCVRRVSTRLGLDHWEWEKSLGITCSIYRGLNKKRGYDMALEENRKTRDYLYGRLLAVGEKVESMALYYANDHREPTAARFMQRFSDRPFSTWKLIENALVPYKARVNSNTPGLLTGYQELLDNIHSLFEADDYTSDKQLTGEYLLGYHCQRKWLQEHKREKGMWVLKTVGDQETQESKEE